mgnify:CR=1 FL=1
MEIKSICSQFMFEFKGMIKTVADLFSQVDYWKTISGIGSICGTISLFLIFFDKWFPPSVKILGIRPIITIKKTKVLNAEAQDKGFHAIIQLKSKGRPVMVNGMIIKGKVYLSGNYAMVYLDHEDNIDNYTEKYSKKRPYINVEWTSRLTDSNLPIKIESHERRYIRVTFLESNLDGTEIDQAFVGYDDGTKQPSRTMINPSLLFNDIDFSGL